MRAIRFRAWHEGQGRMFSAEEMAADQLTLLPTGRFINVSGVSTRLSQIIGDMIPLQFTGLHDKNGKEIYEGDILSSEYKSIGSKRDCHPVTWGSGRWNVDHSVNDCCKPWRGDLNGHHASEEVIGNIYENPELVQ